MARTIYLGSAPNPRNPNKGLTENHIKLGCVQPGESVSTFGDALRRLLDQSTHLYLDGQRYWYDTQQSVARLAQDRVAQYDDDTLYDEIERRLRAEQAERGDFSRVHICPTSSAEVSDDDTAVRLVILKPHYTHGLRDQQSKARAAAREMLDMRGNTRRAYRNTLVFLAADRARLEDLKQGVRSSWPGIPSNRASPAKTSTWIPSSATRSPPNRARPTRACGRASPKPSSGCWCPTSPDPCSPTSCRS